MSSEMTLILAARGEALGPLPSALIEAVEEAVRCGESGYPDPRGTPALRGAIARRLFDRESIELDPEREILVTAGAAPALFTALSGLSGAGDELLLPASCWPPYRHMIEVTGRGWRPYPIADEAGSPEKWLPALLDGRPRLMLVNTPHNPSGRVFDDSWWSSLSVVAQEHPELSLIVDEAWRGIVYGSEPPSPARDPVLSSRSVVIRSFSKTHAMASLRVGYAIGPEACIRRLLAIHLASQAQASAPSQAAAKRALEEPGLAEPVSMEVYRRNRARITRWLEGAPMFRWRPPEGTFYACLDASALGLSSQEMVRRLREEYRLEVLPGTLFGEREGSLRLSFALEPTVLDEALRRLDSLAVEAARNLSG